ncbi:MAG: hypothetical protein Q9191_006123 [Dirinaria sp. TL-2023a]
MPGSARIIPKSWSSTLLLPNSPFPPRALPADRPKYLQKCTDDLYAWQRKRRTGPTFTLHDGPPYANGNLHVGHALNKILKDVLCRYKLSQGYKIDYVPGWDCHGLPIEQKAIEQYAEQRPGSERRKLDAVSIRNAARALASTAVEEQKRAFRGWGIMADWGNAWKTMDRGFELKQLGVFKVLVKKGLIYRRFKPVYWSPSSCTALAEAELEYRDDHVSTAAFVKFVLQSLPVTLKRFASRKINAIIWTTTPWTLPANKAIGVHSDLQYLLAESPTHGLLLLASSRLDDIQKACGHTLDIVHSFLGSELTGATYIDGAFRNDTRPILHAEFVASDSGSGLVHLAPGHGADDYQLCLRHGIDAFAPLDDQGQFTRDASPRDPELLLGKEVLRSGNQSVLDYLRKSNLLLSSHKYKHKYPYDWRSKQPVIIRATEQWFADVGVIRGNALNSLDTVTFIPEGGRDRLSTFVRNRSEWCISRQRAWGVPIPALYNEETGRALLDETSISHIMGVIEDRGIDAWWTDDNSDPVWTPPHLRSSDGSTLYHRGRDTMDVWFDSGTSWTQLSTSNDYGKQCIADIYLEGSDQHRGWFQSSLLTRIACGGPGEGSVVGDAPFKTLITHGFTLDQHSRKMSKSIGNVISPDQIMDGTLLPLLKQKIRGSKGGATPEKRAFHDAQGPDILRLWAASCDYKNDVILSQTVLKAINGTLSKYRVTFKLLLGLLNGFCPANISASSDQLDTVHQIALIHLSKTFTKVLDHYNQFEFNRAAQEINRYINTDLSSFYLESIKDTIYADGLRSASRAQVQLVLLQTYIDLQTMLYPIVPLLVEEALDYTSDQIKDFCAHPMKRANVRDDPIIRTVSNSSLEDQLPSFQRINSAVKSAQELARADKKMGSSLQSQVMFQIVQEPNDTEKAAASFLHRYQVELETMLVVSGVDHCYDPLPKTVAEAEWSYRSDFELDGSHLSAYVYTPQMGKCVRCWRYKVPKEKEKIDPLCQRCSDVLTDLSTTRPELFHDKMQSAMAA